MEDLASFDEDLADHLFKNPAEHLQLVRMGWGKNDGAKAPKMHVHFQFRFICFFYFNGFFQI